VECPSCFVGPCPHKNRDYHNGSNFWKFYLIKIGFTLGKLVSLVKVFRLFRLERIFLVFRVWTQWVDGQHLIYWQGHVFVMPCLMPPTPMMSTSFKIKGFKNRLIFLTCFNFNFSVAMDSKYEALIQGVSMIMHPHSSINIQARDGK
jgi:hypothetical protein